jgi:predicted nuclease of predicted toxin-antitoxin system
MRILANENVAGDVVGELRNRGHDVAWVRVTAPGSPDETVLSLAQRQQRVLVTFDKDFGELVFARGAAASCGVVLLRLTAPSAAALANIVADAIDGRDDWAGSFSVVEPHRIRMQALT